MRGRAGEESRQLGALQQVRARRAVGELAKVAHEVGLIGVAAGVGGRRAARSGLFALQHRDGALKSRQSREPLGRDPDAVQEQPLEVAAGRAHRSREAVDGDQSR